MNIKTLSKISLIINKMGISSQLTSLNFDSNVDNKELGKEIIRIIIDNFYKAENEIIDLIMSIKGISKEEAEQYDVIEFIKELMENEKIKDFLKSM